MPFIKTAYSRRGGHTMSAVKGPSILAQKDAHFIMGPFSAHGNPMGYNSSHIGGLIAACPLPGTVQSILGLTREGHTSFHAMFQKVFPKNWHPNLCLSPAALRVRSHSWNSKLRGPKLCQRFFWLVGGQQLVSIPDLVSYLLTRGHSRTIPLFLPGRHSSFTGSASSS